MSNTIQIKGGNSVPSKDILAYKELGFDFLNGDLYIGDSDGKPLLIAKKNVMDKMVITEQGSLMLNGTTIITDLHIDKIIVGTESRGTSEPSGAGIDGQLYFRIL